MFKRISNSNKVTGDRRFAGLACTSIGPLPWQSNVAIPYPCTNTHLHLSPIQCLLLQPGPFLGQAGFCKNTLNMSRRSEPIPLTRTSTTVRVSLQPSSLCDDNIAPRTCDSKPVLPDSIRLCNHCVETYHRLPEAAQLGGSDMASLE